MRPDEILVSVYKALADRKPLRRLFDAWTQLSRGKLHVQRATGETLEWAWIDDGELRWTVVLGVVVVVGDVELIEKREQLAFVPLETLDQTRLILILPHRTLALLQEHDRATNHHSSTTRMLV